MTLDRENPDRILHEPPVVRVTSLALANTNIQHKQINYDADNIDNNK